MLVDRGSIAGLGNWLTRLPRSCQPVPFGLLELGQRLLRRVVEGGAGEKVWDIGHVAAVLVAPEDVDVVVLHDSITASSGPFPEWRRTSRPAQDLLR